MCGLIEEERAKSALQYSMPKILFGEDKSFSEESGREASAERAELLAAGKLIPVFNSFFKAFLKKSGSSFKNLARVRKSVIESVSAPKHKSVTTPVLASKEIPPSANILALAVANTQGSSKTRSAPPESAILVRSHLFMIAGVPRCMKSPLITTIIKSASVFFLASVSW